jgi:IclR family acetate operon transcriptional repressor
MSVETTLVTTKSAGDRAVERVLVILEALTDNLTGVSITELATQLEISKAQVHRVLTSMVARGYVSQDPLSERYKLTSRLMGMALKHVQRLDIYEIVLPILRALTQETAEMSQLSAVQNERVILVAKVESGRRVAVVNYLGQEEPLHVSGVGKVWLASLPEDDALRILVERGMPRFTERTITSLTEMQSELRTIRAQGYAVNDCEADDDVVAVAAPVYANGPGRQVIGMVATSAVRTRPIHQDPRVIAQTIAAANEISQVWPFANLNP